jgi:hypothetical protein
MNDSGLNHSQLKGQGLWERVSLSIDKRVIFRNILIVITGWHGIASRANLPTRGRRGRAHLRRTVWDTQGRRRYQST